MLFFVWEVLRGLSRNALGCVCDGGERERKLSEEPTIGCRLKEIVRSGKEGVLKGVKRRDG